VGAGPETNTKPAAFTAWLYMGGGVAALVMKMIWRSILWALAAFKSVGTKFLRPNGQLQPRPKAKAPMCAANVGGLMLAH